MFKTAHQVYSGVRCLVFYDLVWNLFTDTTRSLVHLISSFQLRIELAEDLVQLLTDHISKNIQTASDDEQKNQISLSYLLSFFFTPVYANQSQALAQCCRVDC